MQIWLYILDGRGQWPRSDGKIYDGTLYKMIAFANENRSSESVYNLLGRLLDLSPAHGGLVKSISLPNLVRWLLGTWTAFVLLHSMIFSKFRHLCLVLKFGYGSLWPLPVLKALAALPDPFISYHCNIGRTHEILAKDFYAMVWIYQY